MATVHFYVDILLKSAIKWRYDNDTITNTCLGRVIAAVLIRQNMGP